MSRDEEIAVLRRMARQLRDQLGQVMERLDELEDEA
jgi:hypothetical protein